MTVDELIKLLESYPRHLPVAYRKYSEQCMLEADDIVVEKLCKPRDDGWVANKRPDKQTIEYLVLPGN